MPDLSEIERLLATSPLYDAVVDEQQGRDIRIGDHWLIDYASCNYLGFDFEPSIMSAITEQVARWGVHPSWSRLLASPRLYPEIEERMTDLLGAPDCLVLPTLTLIHLYVIPALVQRGTVIMEANSHKSIFDGVTRAGHLGATVQRFRPGRLDQLEELLKKAAPGPRLVCMDGLHSMTGNIPDIPAFARVCREYDATLYVDDAHGFGILGERTAAETSTYGARGNSVIRHFDESYDNVVLVGAFSKAYASLLAFIALPSPLKKYLKAAAGPYSYCGPSPTASLASVLAGLDLNDKVGDRIRGVLHHNTEKVLSTVRSLDLATPNVSGAPIIELPVADGVDLADVAQTLWDRGIYVVLAAYPIVPRDQTGIRLQITATHTDAQLDQVNAVLTELAEAKVLRTVSDS
jgi:8-amino-7-oxononanoate synthase